MEMAFKSDVEASGELAMHVAILSTLATISHPPQVMSSEYLHTFLQKKKNIHIIDYSSTLVGLSKRLSSRGNLASRASWMQPGLVKYLSHPSRQTPVNVYAARL
jgi:hypothetical protein